MQLPLRVPKVLAETRATGVTLAIDYGKKRLGLALSDESGLTANPFATWMRINRRRDLSRLRDLVRERSVRRIIVGLPLHLDGTASEMSNEARSFATRVEKALGIAVEMVDERLTSWEAKQAVSSMDSHRRSCRGSRKAPLDDVAAALILRDYLERRRQDTEPAGGGLRE